ncbi:MAG TPA: hypothetical protein VGR57_02745 [Ktedonobacterales bacterium]|nr:hypothetical protein [Ktedonobacterales bacterium]
MTSRDGGTAAAQGRARGWLEGPWLARLCAWCAAWPWAVPLAAAALGIAARLWLVARTRAMIDGDEAMVGLQAVRILHGQFPTYFYSQAYMGAADAYLAAPLVALLGPTGWALRLVPIILSPLLAILTARLAFALLPRGAAATPLLAGLAALAAGVPPLYMAVTELRTWGGQIEIYVVTLALLLAVVELADRLRAGVARPGQMARRWLALGVLAGLGIWINPLVSYALLAGLLWLLPPLFGRVAPGRWRLPGMGAAPAAPHGWRPGALAPALALLPGLALGGLPAWLYAVRHQGENLLVYLSQPQVDLAASGAARHGRLFLGAAITARYFTCVAPNVLDGRLPTETALLLPPRLLLLLPPLVGLVGAAWLLRRRAADAPRLGLPLLFAAVVTAVFCLGTSAWAATKACALDLAGRYAVPLGLMAPLLLLGVLAAPPLWQAVRARGRRTPVNAPERAGSLSGGALGLTVAILLAGGLLQTATYATVSPANTFQSPYYHDVPADLAPLLSYLAREHIHAAWCNHWLGNIVTYRTAEATTCADYYDQMVQGGIKRPPGTLETVSAAGRPSFILTLSDPHPCLARELDEQGIAYSLATFPGVVVITPVRAVNPASVLAGLKQDYSASTFGPADCPAAPA